MQRAAIHLPPRIKVAVSLAVAVQDSARLIFTKAIPGRKYYENTGGVILILKKISTALLCWMFSSSWCGSVSCSLFASYRCLFFSFFMSLLPTPGGPLLHAFFFSRDSNKSVMPVYSFHPTWVRRPWTSTVDFSCSLTTYFHSGTHPTPAPRWHTAAALVPGGWRRRSGCSWWAPCRHDAAASARPASGPRCQSRSSAGTAPRSMTPDLRWSAEEG